MADKPNEKPKGDKPAEMVVRGGKIIVAKEGDSNTTVYQSAGNQTVVDD